LRRALVVGNRQRVHRVDLRLLRRILQELLHKTWPDRSVDLTVYLVAAPEMTHLNETFLGHKGLTDVITFDYTDSVGLATRRSTSGGQDRRSGYTENARPALLHGEVFVCLDEAVSQARRFRTTWQSELVRYVAHGLLHLLGHDDLSCRARGKMKAAEDLLMRQLRRLFDFRHLSLRN
jgi:rRNA maturation RNase YbeY